MEGAMIVIPSRGTTGFQCRVNRNILKPARKTSEDVHDLMFALKTSELFFLRSSITNAMVNALFINSKDLLKNKQTPKIHKSVISRMPQQDTHTH